MVKASTNDVERPSFPCRLPWKHFAVARQTTEGKWYAAAINAEEQPISMTLHLPMFAGKEVKVYADGPKKAGSLWLTPGMKRQENR